MVDLMKSWILSMVLGSKNYLGPKNYLRSSWPFVGSLRMLLFVFA